MTESEILERNAGQCLSEGELLAYFGTSITDKERHTLELHLNDCPFCSDALEGFEQLPSNRNLQHILDELELPAVQETPEATPRIRILFPWRIAAAFLLVGLSIATLFLLKPDTDSGIAEAPMMQSENRDRESLPAPSTETETLPSTPSNKVVTESKRIPSVVSSASQTNPDTETHEDVSTEDIKNLSKAPVESESIEGPKELAATLESDNRISTVDVQAGSVSSEVHEERTVQLSETTSASSKKSTSATTGSVFYEKGIRAYEAGQYKSCIDLLSRKDVLRDLSIREKALWALAQCQLNTGDTIAARNSLKQVIPIQGRLLNDAKRQLELLK
ncbi:MAG: hypothetical protein LW707_10095 [Sphingobacteriales bacterium]|nr:hypothetical protein [Sphingobacteriales bacterium]